MICPSCGKECSETAKFCSACGTAFESIPVNTPVPDAASHVGDTEKQQSVLNNMYRFLKYRRLACKISAIFMLVLSLFFILVGGIFAVVGVISITGNYPAQLAGFGLGYGITWLVMGILYLPIAFVNFAMVSKTSKLMNELYVNVRPAANYCGSIGQLILCYFFNEIALVFAIIGFVNAKTKAEIINQIEHNQKLNVPPCSEL